jgi:protein-S-isoprenylcysteine O-methyltransferase Ste14
LWSSGEIHAVIARVLVTVAYWRKISMEERAQSGAFNVEDEEYRRNTWSLIPGVY